MTKSKKTTKRRGGLSASKEMLSDLTVRWIKVHSVTDGFITLNMDAIATIMPCGCGFSMRMISGSLILMTQKEGNRVLSRILPEGIRP